ncbi:MAG: hypothetical protein SLAVMIC_00287 [uncultured marine phage]|uniref:Uncharacterized protein n=1 Tax=uncultured marine phage TaxID=707152 RepID=A0A8D9CBZ7_9VIRU|nr:MAG: hypothetical protein SLAVMIC_00287 [uncultured marine phage]
MPKKEPMKAKSKSQRRLFGWASACVNDPKKDCPTKIKKLGDTFKEKYPQDLKSLSKTKHAGLPERKKSKKKNETVVTFGEYVGESISSESMDLGNVIVSLPLKDFMTEEYGLLIEFDDGSFLEYSYSTKNSTDYYENLEKYSDVTGWDREDIESYGIFDHDLSKQIADWFSNESKSVKIIRKIDL